MRGFVRTCRVSRMRRFAPVLTLLVGCNSPAYLALTAAQDALPDSDGLSTGDGSIGAAELTTSGVANETGSGTGESATTGAPEATQTSSGESGEPGASSTGEPPANAPPQVFAFAVSPDEVFDASEAQLELEASDDVVEVDVRYGETLLATVPIAAFPYAFDVTSQAACDGTQTFTVTVRDAEGLTDTAEAELYCQLPAAGSEVYTRLLPGDSASRGTAVASLPDGTAIVAGVLDGHMALWRLDPEGDLTFGWPKTLAAWTLTPGLAAKESSATAVALDATGAIVVAGTTTSGLLTRRYLAKLSDKGALLWEDPGLEDGEEISGLAVSADGDIVAAGSVRTSPVDQSPAYDSATWGYPKAGERWTDIFGQPESDPQPDIKNIYSERAHAVLDLPDGKFVVVGDREYKGDDQWVYSRTTTQRYTSAGARDGALWTSPGLKVAHDAGLAGTVTDNGFVVTGWCRHKPDKAIRQVCVQEFDTTGALVGFFVETSPMQAEARAVAQDRERKLVIGGYSTKPGQLDAWVFASSGADQPLAWSLTYDGGGWDFAEAVACDLWGHCTWVGTTTQEGALALVVSRRHP